MSKEMLNIYNELNELADEFGLNKPKSLDQYIYDAEILEEIEDLLDEEFSMVSFEEMAEQESIDVDSYEYANDDLIESELNF